MTEVFLFLFAGVLSGFLGGLFGIGGGIILVPFLTLYSNMSLVEASGISLFCIIGTSLSVSYRKLKSNLVNLELATGIEATALAFGFVGSLLAHKLDEQVVKVCFALMVSLLAVSFVESIFIKQRKTCSKVRESEENGRDPVADHTQNRHDDDQLDSSNQPLVNKMETPVPPEVNKIAFQGIVALAGLFAGLLGIGGGVLIVPLINKVARLPIKIATATSAYIMGMTTAGATLTHVMVSNFSYKFAILALGGVRVGSWAGVEASQFIPDWILKICFFLLLVSIAIKMWMIVL